MSDLIEIKLSAEIADDSISKIKQQLAEIEKESKIKLDGDTKDIDKKLKDVEKNAKNPMKMDIDTGKAESEIRKVESATKGLRETSVKTFKDASGEVTGFAITMQDASKRIKEVETFAKGAEGGFKSLGKTITDNVSKPVEDMGKALKENLKLDNTTEEMSRKLTKLGEDFGDLVKPEDTAKVKDMMKQLDPSDIKFPEKVKEINNEIKNLTTEFTRAKQPIVDMGNALKENLKLDNTIEQTTQKLEAMSREFGDLVRPEDRKNVEGMMKALDPSDKMYPEKVREMNIELKRMSDTAKGVLKDQNYMIKQHEQALRMNEKTNIDMTKQHTEALKMNEKFNRELANAQMPKNVNASQFGGDMQTVGRGIIALAAPILAVGAASIKASVQFESSFAGVNSCPLYR